jgi:DNA-binding transcriptional ArsR family regulator
MTDTLTPSLPLHRAARLFRLLGSPSCVLMLLELDSVGQAHASTLAKAAGLSERRAREHLCLLRHAGVVEFRPAGGRLRLYRLAPGLARYVLELVCPGGA